MKIGIKKHISATLWLFPKQFREAIKGSWIFVAGTVFLSLLLSTIIMSAVIKIEGILEESGVVPNSQLGVMPAAKLARAVVQWGGERGKEREGGALEGVRIWLDCAQASSEQCQQGVELLDGVGAKRVEKDAGAQLDLRWKDESWEIGSRADRKYVLPAAVVLHSQSTKGSWQHAFRPRFVPVQESANSVEEHAQGFLTTGALQIIVLGLLIPSILIATTTSGMPLSTTLNEIEDGRYEPMASVILPPWVLLLSKSIASGVLAGAIVLGLTILISLMVGPVPLAVALAFSASMALVTLSACLWGFLLIPIQVFLGKFPTTRFLRTLPNPAMAVPALFVYLLVIGPSLSASELSGFMTRPDRERVLPLVDWGMAEAFVMVSGCAIYAAISLAVLLLAHLSPWGRRRISLRAGKA